MPHLSLSLLGPFRATLDGAPLESLRYDKARALLAYLAMESARPQPRDKLIGLLWPDYAESAARQNLSQALSALRRALGEADPPFLLTAPDRVQWNPESETTVDALEMADLMAACQRHPHDQTADCPACLARLEHAATLYQGPFGEGLDLPDAPEFEEWCSLQRERCQRLALQALGWLAEAYGERHRYGEALEVARRAEALDPWHEETQRLLMRLLAESGDRNAALAQYEDCREALRRELGVEPTPETAQLYERIRGGEIGRAQPAAEGAGRRASLPASMFPLVGREQELARLISCLRDPACRLVTVLGPGGVGKTRLAVEACQGVASAFAHGLCFAPLSAAPADGLTSAIAQACGFSFYREAGISPEEQLLAYLRGKQVLLALDSCEHLLESMGLIARILAEAPGIKVLATSRARLNLPGEQLFPLEGLALAPTVEAETGSAVELFLAAARRARPGYALPPSDAPAVAAICQRVEGLPLALLLAASWMHMLSPAEIAAELAQDTGHGLDLLAADWQGVPERERSMRATLDRSWSLLSEQDQGILAGLSVFRGGFAAERAEAERQAAERAHSEKQRDRRTR